MLAGATVQLYIQLNSSGFRAVGAIASCFHVLVWMLVVSVSIRQLLLYYCIKARDKSMTHMDPAPTRSGNISLSHMEHLHNAHNGVVQGVNTKGVHHPSSGGVAEPHGGEYIIGMNASMHHDTSPVRPMEHHQPAAYHHQQQSQSNA